ncbi:MAG: glycosyltransferase [Yaniella sp.]|nr:glycosyltransferase [Yaniella sp.]
MLTVSPKHATSNEALRDQLIADERLDERVAFRNPWSDFRHMPEDEISRLADPPEYPSPVKFEPFDGEHQVTRKDSSGRTTQTDLFREDGTISIIDHREMSETGKTKTRIISLLTRNGQIAKQWPSSTSMYKDWLAHLTQSHEMSILISERLTVSNQLNGWSRDNITFVQAIHSNHFSTQAMQKYDFPPPKARFYESLDSRDLVAALTQQQANDLHAMDITAVNNVATLPNWLTNEPLRRPTPRDKRAGVIVSRIAPEKQIEHSLYSICQLSERDNVATLDIFGEGSSRPALENLSAQLGIESSVTFHGYAPAGGRKFRDYSFSLLTSKSEGQGLVLLESMAGGCIPIAYNIKYGPADIISHGVNGFLLEPDDVTGLARQIEQLINMPESDLLALRRAAIRRSRDFLPKKIVYQWAKELHGAIHRKQSRIDPVQSRARVGSVRLKNDALHLRLRVPKALEDGPWEWAKLSWVQRGTRTYGRVSADLFRKNSKLIVRATVPFDNLAPSWPTLGSPTDFWLDLGEVTQFQRIRIRADEQAVDLQYGDLELYITKAGNLSARVRGQSINE